MLTPILLRYISELELESSKPKIQYDKIDEFVKGLKAGNRKEISSKDLLDDFDYDYIVDNELMAVMITSKGYDKIAKEFNINLDETKVISSDIVYNIMQSMKANKLLSIEKDYILENGKIVRLDKQTGKKLFGRVYLGGLQQAVEAKEDVKISDGPSKDSMVSVKGYFKLYDRICGMTSTAKTVRAELKSGFNLDVVEIPPDKTESIISHPDVIFVDDDKRDKAVIGKVIECNSKGQPVLIGTSSIEKSEKIGKSLRKIGIKNSILNNKNPEHEASIIAKAGKPGSVTIITDTAGIGVDIKLGGLIWDKEWVEVKSELRRAKKEVGDLWDWIWSIVENIDKCRTPNKLIHINNNSSDIDRLIHEIDARISAGVYVSSLQGLRDKLKSIQSRYSQLKTENHIKSVEAGGLMVIGVGRNRSRRIDDKLKGRAARRGDPGECIYYISLDDDIFKSIGGLDNSYKSALNNSKKDHYDFKLITSVMYMVQKHYEAKLGKLRISEYKPFDIIDYKLDEMNKYRRCILCEDDPDKIHKIIRDIVDRYLGDVLDDERDIMTVIDEDVVLKYIFDSDEFNQLGDNLSDFNSAVDRILDKKFKDKEIRLQIERAILLDSIDKKLKWYIYSICALKEYNEKGLVDDFMNQLESIYNESETNMQEEVVRGLLGMNFEVGGQDE